MTPVLGQLRRIHESNGSYLPVEDHGVIILCPSLSLEWHRFILVKEASHLMLDKPTDFIHTEVDLDNLLLCMAQFGTKGVTRQYVSEQRAVVCAMELLFPKVVRDQILPLYKEGKLSPATISKAARIPAEIVREAMSEEYCDMIEPLHGEG
jgi:Zn-dependent peptidase ImmA (M78 family)